jgi:hypothetical protein
VHALAADLTSLGSVLVDPAALERAIDEARREITPLVSRAPKGV